MEPKINSKLIPILRKMYLEEKLSTVDIEEQSVERFGFYVSRGTIYKTMVKNQIIARCKSESVSRGKSTLDIDTSFVTEETIEWVDGLMLGDGYINFDNNYQGARYRIGSSAKEWAEYAMLKLSAYDPSKAETFNSICERRPNPIWESSTKTHPDIVIQARRWYGGINETKKIPLDCCITPASVMLWYLGDGSFTYTKDGNIPQLRLATCAFDIMDIENILMPKLKDHGINTTRYTSKNDIHICSESIKDFFNFIGWKSPIACYDHKFDIPEWLKLIRLSEIVKDDKEKWRAQYYYKQGIIECSKSPGGKMLLFTREQAAKLREKLWN